jgi:nucleotide-binding universal stress UspA family protein
MYERILIPLDCSQKAAQALPYTVSFVRAFDASCTLLAVVPNRVVERPVLVAAGAASHEDSSLDVNDPWFAAEGWMTEAREHLLKDEWIPTSLVVREGRPAEEIVKFAKEGNFDLIVLTILGQGAVDNPDRPPVIGSVADEVLRFLPCPCWLSTRTVRSSEGDFRPQARASKDAYRLPTGARRWMH